QYWAASHPPPNILVAIDDGYIQEFVDGYKTDVSFKERWNDPKSSNDKWHAGKRYYKDQRGLLFFRDADFQPKLCVPSSQRAAILREAHESAVNTAHAG
ncbi:hypothetical protein PLICRDRAFT_73172, partial [Plicaturopsis crispa FD-325 SS-3]